jgi:hypothetical protein
MSIFTAKYFFDCACRDLGLEAPHTIAIGKIVEIKKTATIAPSEYWDDLAKLVYNDGIKRKDEEEEIAAYLDELEAQEAERDCGMMGGCYGFTE